MKYLHGCNYPWSTDGTTVYYGLDFGASVWGSHLGVSTRRAAIRRDFAEMAALGFVVVRWFVFCDGRAGIVYDDRGWPSGPDAHLFADLDAALEIAGDTGIGIDLVLFDHHWMFRGIRETIADPVTGDLLEARLPEGRARVLLSSSGRDALFERLIVPLVKRYGPAGDRADLAPQLLAFEFMNEPDFVIEEWEQDLSVRVARPLSFGVMAELVSRLGDAVHRHSRALTTLGGARLHNLWAWDDDALGIDLLQVHTYPDVRRPRQDADLFGSPAFALGMRRPVIIGEFPATGLPSLALRGTRAGQYPAGDTPPPSTLDDYLECAVSGGYAGAWPWSFSGTDAHGRLPVEPLKRFAAQHPELVNPRSAV